ncbi:MAG: ATP-binding protein [Pseudomonadota bacterium]
MPHESMLHLICGMAGSGKTTLAKKLEDEHAAIRLSPDEWIEPLLQDKFDRPEMDRMRPHIHDLQWALAKRLLGVGNNVIWEQGFWQLEERRQCLHGARTIGAKVMLHYLDIPIVELKRRIQARNAQLPAGSFHVEPGEIDIWMQWFELPSDEELSSFDAYRIYNG